MTTALELEREDWRRYRRGSSRRLESEQLSFEEKQERDRLVARARELAKMLKEQFGVRKIVLFGSLARTSWFTPSSDVDLAVEGLETREYWRAWSNRLHPLLVASQTTSGPLAGSWDPQRPVPDKWADYGGGLFVTATNLLSLEIYHRRLAPDANPTRIATRPGN